MILVFSSSLSWVSAQQQNVTGTVATRTAPLEIKVVLIGFDQSLIDKEYFKWNSPERRYQLFQIPGISTNTEYSLTYEYVFPDKTFTNEMVHFLNSNAKKELRQNVIWNMSHFKINTRYYWNYTHFPVRSSNTFYAADGVENWLVQHQSDYGGVPKNGYALVLADFSAHIPSATVDQFRLALQGKEVEFTPHFYNKTYEDSDLRIMLNRRYMTAWGGHSRLFFADLSAGPEEAAEQLPIQIASAANSIDLSNPYGKAWLNQYLADYVWGAVYNLFAPDFVYPINFSSEYKVKVLIIDNRTDTADPPITKTFDPDAAAKELQVLVPWGRVTAEARYVRVADYPELAGVIANSRSPATYGNAPYSPAVDARPVYDWLSENGQGHIKDFMEIKRDSQEYDIPVFAFAFTGDYQFGFTYKELVGQEPEFDRTIWGVALYDLVLISHATSDLKRGDTWRTDPPQPGRGFGFTNTVIHEVGHMLGLMHPFQTSYDPTENFVASVMAYYPYEQGFSVFDRDALTRGQADQLLRATEQVLAETPFLILNQPDIADARSKAESAEKAYSSMEYGDAVRYALDALVAASRARTMGGGFIPVEALNVVQLVGSFILGALVTFLLFRRRGKTGVSAAGVLQVPHMTWCPTCGRQLTWIPEYERWYCFNCQKYQ